MIDEEFYGLVKQKRRLEYDGCRFITKCDSPKQETSQTLRNKRRQYLKDKVNEMKTSSRNKNMGDLYKSKLI
jgi:hypothetical protein